MSFKKTFLREDFVRRFNMGRVYSFISFAICMSSIWQMCDANCYGPVPCTDNTPCRNDQACLPSKDGTQTVCRVCSCKDKGQCRTDTISGKVTCDCGTSGWSGPFCTCKRGPCSGKCPYGFTLNQGTCTCYAGFLEYVTWDEAKVRCQSKSASLVKITSAAENTFVRDLMVSSLLGPTSNRFWLGGNDLATEGDWIWDIDSTEITYSNWQPYAPNNGGGVQHCLEMLVYSPSPAIHGYWNDNKCSYVYPYICEFYL